MPEAHNQPTARSGSRFPLGTPMLARRRRWLGVGRFRDTAWLQFMPVRHSIVYPPTNLPRIDLDQGNYWHGRL